MTVTHTKIETAWVHGTHASQSHLNIMTEDRKTKLVPAIDRCMHKGAMQVNLLGSTEGLAVVRVDDANHPDFWLELYLDIPTLELMLAHARVSQIIKDDKKVSAMTQTTNPLWEIYCTIEKFRSDPAFPDRVRLRYSTEFDVSGPSEWWLMMDPPGHYEDEEEYQMTQHDRETIDELVSLLMREHGGRGLEDRGWIDQGAAHYLYLSAENSRLTR